MDKLKVLSTIKDKGLVAVVRADDADSALRIAHACREGGVAALEVAFTTPGAHHVIERLAKEYQHGEILLGAGTVLDDVTARIAILSGAQYLISPALNEGTALLANRYRVPYMPGVLSVRDVVNAMELGCDVMKLFPGELYGPAAIKAIRAPLPQAQLMPVGGVTPENVADWIKAGAVAVAAGGGLIAGAKQGDYDSIVTKAKQFIERIQAARRQLA